MVQRVKNPPSMQETWVWSLGCEDPLKEGMTTHSSTLAWRIPWTEEPRELQSMGSQSVKHDWVTKHSTIHSFIVYELIKITGRNTHEHFPVLSSILINWLGAQQEAIFMHTFLLQVTLGFKLHSSFPNTCNKYEGPAVAKPWSRGCNLY